MFSGQVDRVLFSSQKIKSCSSISGSFFKVLTDEDVDSLDETYFRLLPR